MINDNKWNKYRVSVHSSLDLNPEKCIDFN